MAGDDEAARKERAARLRRQIEAMKKRKADKSAPIPPPRTPRDFIHEKMRNPESETPEGESTPDD
jgi:hypothetical protein